MDTVSNNIVLSSPHSFLITGSKIHVPIRVEPEHEQFQEQRRRKRRKSGPHFTKELFRLSSNNNKMLSTQIRRAGIIPYTLTMSGDIIFCFGIDRKSGDYSDFGGGYSNRRDGLPVIRAVQELKEESLDIIHVRVKDLADEPCILQDRIMTTFAYLNPKTFFEIPSKFEDALLDVTNEDSVEMMGIKLIFESKINDEIQEARFYTVLSKLLETHLDDAISMIKENAVYRL